MKNLLDLYRTIETYTDYLLKHGVKLNKKGFPFFKREHFLNQWPDIVVPYDFRNSKIVKNSQRTVLSHYIKDVRIYPRLEKIFEEIEIYSLFMGTIMTDVTVAEKMEPEWIDLIMLANQLYSMILVVNGIKVVANLRTGGQSSLSNFDEIPHNVMWATGFLGCEKDNEFDTAFISSLMYVRPSKLIVYGKEDDVATERMNMMGFDYRYYQDYHKASKNEKFL